MKGRDERVREKKQTMPTQLVGGGHPTPAANKALGARAPQPAAPHASRWAQERQVRAGPLPRTWAPLRGVPQPPTDRGEATSAAARAASKGRQKQREGVRPPRCVARSHALGGAEALNRVQLPPRTLPSAARRAPPRGDCQSK